METVAGSVQEKKPRLFINVVSIIVPLVVAVLLGLPAKLDLGAWTKTLPHFIGLINALTTVVLIVGFVFIKQNKIDYHRVAMTVAFSLGGLFLIFYVTYHLTNPANKFAGEGFARYVYFFFLITHVALSLVVLPLVLRAMFYAVTGQFEKHKKLTRYAFPVWLYVSATGVIVYLMLYQLFTVK
jgi:putative membrane protein